MSLASYLAEAVKVLDAAGQVWSDAHVSAAIRTVVLALREGKPVLVCGNGGSAADAMHITAEMVGRFLLQRRALNVICLCSNSSVITALANDLGYEDVFSRQVEAYAQPGGVLIGLSTSGKSLNVIQAFAKARSMGMRTVALTGEGGGDLAALSDHLFAVPSRNTPAIQQAHLCLYHYLCQSIEEEFEGERTTS
ncbi:MAG: phosphoheptose isomerase [Terriglobia bacterium]|nr:MAG: phosphoheptose isomerase [Terriglobia bacterium]